MGLLHKLGVGIKRIFQGGKIEYVSESKRFGNEAEVEFERYVKDRLANCEIKSNVIIHSNNFEAEIDCLILYKNNLFAIEIKHWKGRLIEQGDFIISQKRDKYTGEIHQKTHRSPFKQIKRAIMGLKEINNASIWVEPIVYFVEADSVEIVSQENWFEDVDNLLDFIMSYKNYNRQKDVINCFNKSYEADCLYSSNTRVCRGIVDKHFNFKVDDERYSKEDISSIEIKHHFSFDELKIVLRSGKVKNITVENGNISIYHNKKFSVYNFSKITFIKFGEN